MSAFSLSACPQATRTTRRSQASRLVARAADRPLWYPGTKPPAWLDGSKAGDYGFDPIGLGSDPQILEYFVHAELINARWAMLGAAGILIPGLLTKAGLLSVPAWFVAGKVAQDASDIPFNALVAVEAILFAFVELKRIQDFRKPGSQADGSFLGVTDGFKGKGNGYPGGFFDPMGMSNNASTFETMKKKELANGRLAMGAMLGFFAQYAATGKDPMDNLFDHIASPGTVNFATNGVSFPRPPGLV